jgi:hypothetical protein
MKTMRLAAAAAAALLGAGVAVAAATTGAGAAPAGTVICEQYGSATSPDGRYIVQNNRWGSTTEQCVTITSGGFTLTRSAADVPTNGAPAGYPSIYWGCHYGNCTPGFAPIQLSSAAFAGVGTSVSMTYPSSGQWNAAYDIWLDPTPRTNGQNTGAEIMVWLNHRGLPQPVGSRVATVSLAGGTWDVWFGNIGWNVVSYVRTSATGSISFPVSTFTNDAISRGYASRSWYLTSIQAGFEPWTGGAGLAVTAFSVTTGGTGPTSTPTNPGGSLACAASYAVTQSWGDGFTADVTVRNTGTRPTTGWTVTWTYGGTQRITNAWNAAVTQTGTSVRATNLGYNGALAPGASTTFGFQASYSGSTGTPSLTCTAT